MNLMPKFFWLYVSAIACGLNGVFNLMDVYLKHTDSDALLAVIDLSLCLVFFLLGSYAEYHFLKRYRRKTEKKDAL